MADTWHVTAQNQRNVLTASGQFQTVVEVHFQTTNGATGTVQVPLSQYTADEVKKRVDAYAATLDAVHQL